MQRSVIPLVISILIWLLVSTLEAGTRQQNNSSIRAIDFANFTYPLTSGLRGSKRSPRTFTLRDRKTPEAKHSLEMYLANVTYGDVTGDGKEEAIVRIGIQTGGSAMPNVV